MRPYFEDLSCRLRLSPGFPASFPEHLHTQLELVCLFSGRARMLVDGRTLFLEPGDVCLCFPGATHGYAGSEAAEGLMLIAAPEQFPDFAELLERRRPASPVVRMDELPPDAALCLDQLRRECARETSEPAVRGYVQVLLARMLPRMELVDPPSVHSDTAYRIMRYLSRHFAEPLTLTELGTRGLARPAITEADLDTLTADAMLARGMRGRNPRVNGERDIRVLYASVL